VSATVSLAVLGAWVSIQPPKRKSVWLIAFIVLGAGTTAATLYQVHQTRADDAKARAQDARDKKNLQDKIDALQKKVDVLSDTSIPKLLGDVKGLERPKARLPDLTLRFVHPQEVAIAIDNAPNAGIADRPKYGVQLVDLDNLAANYLGIPTNMGDYIRPGEFWGPNQFMGIDGVKSVVKPADRIFGSVSISCPMCVKSRAYWVYIKAGDGGWYAEQSGPPKGLANLDAARKISADFETYVNMLAPPSTRVLIK
jgi:hypothetical protein